MVCRVINFMLNYSPSAALRGALGREGPREGPGRPRDDRGGPREGTGEEGPWRAQERAQGPVGPMLPPFV